MAANSTVAQSYVSKQRAFVDLGKQRTMKQAFVSISVTRIYSPFEVCCSYNLLSVDLVLFIRKIFPSSNSPYEV